MFPAIAEITETVAYDRSGLGRSRTDPAPRSLERLADDLVDLLDHLGDGPFLLVGHSWGGPIVRSPPARRRSGSPGWSSSTRPTRAPSSSSAPATPGASAVFLRLLAGARAASASFRITTRRLAKRLPDDGAAAMRAEDGTVAAMRTQRAEMAGSIDDLRALRSDPPAVPDVPIDGDLRRAVRAARAEPPRPAGHRAPGAGPCRRTGATSWPSSPGTWCRSPNPASSATRSSG